MSTGYRIPDVLVCKPVVTLRPRGCQDTLRRARYKLNPLFWIKPYSLAATLRTVFAAIERIPPYCVDHYPKEYSSMRALTTVCGPPSRIFKKDNDRVILRLLRSLIFRSQKAKNFQYINFIFLCIVLSSSKCLAIVLAKDSSLLICLPATKLVQILPPPFIYQFATYRMPHATGHTIILIGNIDLPVPRTPAIMPRDVIATTFDDLDDEFELDEEEEVEVSDEENELDAGEGEGEDENVVEANYGALLAYYVSPILLAFLLWTDDIAFVASIYAQQGPRSDFFTKVVVHCEAVDLIHSSVNESQHLHRSVWVEIIRNADDSGAFSPVAIDSNDPYTIRLCYAVLGALLEPSRKDARRFPAANGIAGTFHTAIRQYLLTDMTNCMLENICCLCAPNQRLSLLRCGFSWSSSTFSSQGFHYRD
ncbi:hypothetical protein ARMGADRAFT_1077107 [Armillaria gallica]|uniref:Uncharacterized protein n=1 Tax=Armillaria gallica TaxID=47427 RepID=A0A2H3DP26_ARMGA|nr:hypothetical protein ARMGADRAFT_1077107 [Armillaria gallica]